MIIWGHYNRDRRENTGPFFCPACDEESGFVLIRTWEYFHIYFIPLIKQGVVAERVECDRCRNAFPITVLASTAEEVTSAFDAGNRNPDSVLDNFGNVVKLTDSAIHEIRDRRIKGEFDDDVVVRVAPDPRNNRRIQIAFDFALADGRDWIGHTKGLVIVVDRDVAP